MTTQEKQIKPVKVVLNRFLIPVSLTETVTDLKRRGYIVQFRREATCLYCVELNSWIAPGSFTVDEQYHLEDNDNPDGDRMIYAISTTEGLNGFLVDTCFVYEDNISPEMREKLELEYFIYKGITN